MLKTLPAFAALAAAGALLVPTVGEAADSNSVRVSYADLNLRSSVGQEALQRRIAFAAETVCFMGEQPFELKMVSATKACRADAVAGARPAYEAAVASARRGTVTVLDGAALIVTAK